MILRTYTIYNFTNPDEVLWLNHIPEFVEFGANDSYVYQEKTNYTKLAFKNETYPDDTVDFYKWERYYHMNNTMENENLKLITVNFGPLKNWYKIKHSSWASLAFNSLATLVMDLNNELHPAVIA